MFHVKQSVGKWDFGASFVLPSAYAGEIVVLLRHGQRGTVRVARGSTYARRRPEMRIGGYPGAAKRV